MAIVISREVRVVVPVGVSTQLSPISADRLSFSTQCEDLGTDWHVTLSVPATSEDGVRVQGRGGFNLAGSIPGQGNSTQHYEGPINVFVTAAAGIATVGFWVIETEESP